MIINEQDPLSQQTLADFLANRAENAARQNCEAKHRPAIDHEMYDRDMMEEAL
ncbi:hypothetical protein [Streptomyces sp. Rer75]|uniref:hypothetical protein n=1 Tax=Streptomyces sp. Rer75 TaxID=2750011 RepID=UPI0015CF8C8C|nr:hypothetical protein [Streptomyces sp. Rer75]QLH20563.1 hypothetical protein HYQ63_07860 [Streptomyces sp. Rer75]